VPHLPGGRPESAHGGLIPEKLLSQLRGSLRPRQQRALSLLTAVIQQPLELTLTLDTFRDNHRSETLAVIRKNSMPDPTRRS
jgi:hypothetical protein